MYLMSAHCFTIKQNNRLLEKHWEKSRRLLNRVTLVLTNWQNKYDKWQNHLPFNSGSMLQKAYFSVKIAKSELIL